MSDAADNVERLRRTAQSLGSAVVILTAAEGEQIADEIVELRAALRPFAVSRATIENMAAEWNGEDVPYPTAEVMPITPMGSGEDALAAFLASGGSLAASDE
jgi:hypothetical protein